MAERPGMKVELKLEPKGLPGAPVLTLDLVLLPDGTVTGTGDISAAVTPEVPAAHIPLITGTFGGLPIGPPETLIQLSGTYYSSLPPPLIGTYSGPFSAGLDILIGIGNGTGAGGFSYGNHSFPDCIATDVDSEAGASVSADSGS